MTDIIDRRDSQDQGFKTFVEHRRHLIGKVDLLQLYIDSSRQLIDDTNHAALHGTPWVIYSKKFDQTIEKRKKQINPQTFGIM